jgi:hypothetical protein
MISLVYFILFCVNSNISWIDNTKPVSEQYESIAKFKINTLPKDFCDKNSKFLCPILTYVYKLEFTERPDYN